MKTINIKLTNKMWIWSILSIIFSTFLIGVYAYTNPIPNPGHGADSILVSLDGEEMTLEQAFDVTRNITWTCVSFNRTEGSGTTPLFAGSSDGNAYSVAEVVEATGTVSIRCKQENGWAMTDCSDSGIGINSNEEMGANDCTGDISNSPDVIAIRCCKINLT